MARPDGFESPTTAFEAQCSIQLSYGRNLKSSSAGLGRADIDSVIDVRAVFQLGFRDLDFAQMPTLLRPS